MCVFFYLINGLIYPTQHSLFSFFRVDSTPDDTVGEGKMYAREGNPMCPVFSFTKYLSKLNENIDDLWQRPLDSFNESDTVWYYKSPMGKTTLGNMMPEISRIANLSKKYTNHCIRATSITALDRAGFEARHIMRASGHKSEASIRSYSYRLSEEKKREMSDSLSDTLSCNKNDFVSKKDDENQFDDISEGELLDLFSDDNLLVEIMNSKEPLASSSNISKNGNSTSAMTTPSLNEHNYLSLNQNMALNTSINSIAPQIIQPHTETVWQRNPHYFINPNMNNCTVNFNFHGN